MRTRGDGDFNAGGEGTIYLLLEWPSNGEARVERSRGSPA